MKNKVYEFKNYSDIPDNLKDYILDVSGETHIEDIPIEHINSFLNGNEIWSAEDEVFEAIANATYNRNKTTH